MSYEALPAELRAVLEAEWLRRGGTNDLPPELSPAQQLLRWTADYFYQQGQAAAGALIGAAERVVNVGVYDDEGRAVVARDAYDALSDVLRDRVPAASPDYATFEEVSAVLARFHGGTTRGIEMEIGILVLLELAQQRDEHGPRMKVRLDAGLAREDGARSVRVRVEVDGGFDADDVKIVLGVAERHGARIALQNSAIELTPDPQVERRPLLDMDAMAQWAADAPASAQPFALPGQP